jgi:serine protease Do
MDEQGPVPGRSTGMNEGPLHPPVVGSGSESSQSGRDGMPASAGVRGRARKPQPAASDFFYTLFWLLCCAAFVIGLWHIGPLVAERYQFAISRGKATAEYEHASAILESDPLASLSTASELVVQKIRPSVVSIECRKFVGGRRGDQRWVEGQGSGVVIGSEGLILTNAHVVADSVDLTVTLFDQRKLPGVILGVHTGTDLAVIRVDASGLIPATWGDSESLRVGSMVWAVGSPYGLEQTVTSGIVSGKDRYDTQADEIDRFPRSMRAKQLIQTDAAVNKGNSGGPLVNSRGEVVGINSSIVGEEFQGISFAIPSSIAQYISRQLAASGNAQIGFMGIEPRAVSDDDMRRRNLPDLQGAYVATVAEDSPAEEAGLLPDDIIRSWNGVLIEQANMLYRLVATTEPGTTALLSVWRDGSAIELSIRVRANPQS